MLAVMLAKMAIAKVPLKTVVGRIHPVIEKRCPEEASGNPTLKPDTPTQPSSPTPPNPTSETLSPQECNRNQEP